MLQGTMRAGVEAKLICVPEHRGIEGSEMADRYAEGNEK